MLLYLLLHRQLVQQPFARQEGSMSQAIGGYLQVIRVMVIQALGLAPGWGVAVAYSRVPERLPLQIRTRRADQGLVSDWFCARGDHCVRRRNNVQRETVHITCSTACDRLGASRDQRGNRGRDSSQCSLPFSHLSMGSTILRRFSGLPFTEQRGGQEVGTWLHMPCSA